MTITITAFERSSHGGKGLRAPDMSTNPRRSTTGLRQFLNVEQQRNWIEGKTNLPDADERSESMELRFNASWMELFTIYADGEGIRARFIVHLSDFITDHSPARGQVDEVLLEHCVTTPEDVSYFFPRGEDIFGINVRGSASIHKFLAAPTCCAPFEDST